MTPKFRSRYPLLLPRPDDSTPRWQRIAQLAELQPDNFTISDVPGCFRIITRKKNSKLNDQVVAMLTKMDVSAPALSDILEIDPIQTIPTTVRTLWVGRGFKVAEYGIITVKFISSDKIYQYPFIEV